MSYDEKLAESIASIENYNSQLDDAENKIDTNTFRKKIRKMGCIDADSLKLASYEDIEECGLPRILARKVAAIFRSENKTKLGDGDHVSEKKASRMSPLYLLQQYTLGDIDTPVAKRLAELSRGARFLVVEGGSVNVQESFKILNELQKGYEDREVVVIDGRPVRPVKIGDKKKEMVDENPIYAGRPLRPDGTCDQLNRSWDGVPLSVRQIIYLAIHDTKEITPSHTVAHDLLDKALISDAEKAFRTRYAKASVRLDELSEEGKSPTLKIALGNLATKRNDPFHHKTF